ncbi:MAG: phosphotransferase [Candidatus Sabulitectum sp.]|nr:phosphotransferase [Candidatus Sabulitectum sp.]
MKSLAETRFSILMKDDALCSELVENICSSNSFNFKEERIYEGSRILYEIEEDKIVKVFSQNELSFCNNEAKYLETLHGKLSVTTPELFVKGIYNGLPFLIMQKQKGFPLKSVWNDISIWEKRRIIAQIADMLKELHSLPCELFPTREPGWKDFINTQTLDLLQNHRESGLSNAWTENISRFIQNTDEVENSSESVICHTEIMQEHLFVEESNRGFNITGLIDFEPSMIAVPEYDFCSIGLFISAGDKGLFNHFLDTYGYKGDSRGIMRMLLLHRYSNMKWFMSTLPDTVRFNSVEELSDYWF